MVSKLMINGSAFLYGYRLILRGFLYLYSKVISLLKVLRKERRPRRKKLEILVTGTFYSDLWLATHLKPLAISEEVAVVTMVATDKVPNLPNVEALYPPLWLTRVVGKVLSRLIAFVYYGIKRRPDVVVGFHILLNGLVALFLAKLLSIRSIYICGGGPREVMGGGYSTENRIFSRIGEPDEVIEAQLLSLVSDFDLVVSMGTGAIEYFRSKGVDTHFEIVPGGFDEQVFFPREDKEEAEYDLILIGRLSEVKRVDIFLQTIQKLRDRCPNIRAVIVGDGPDRMELEIMTKKLGIEENVFFAGWQSSVACWLRRSKVFVLTSESEGLSQALIQAMMCALPAVVTDVGDLSDLVKEGENGFLVKELNSYEFEARVFELLSCDERLELFGQNAYTDAKRYHIGAVCDRWNSILARGFGW